MTDFTRWMSSHWPLDLPKASPDLTQRWIRFIIYNELLIAQIKEQDRTEPLFNAWLLMADPAGTQATLPLPPITADPLSGLNAETIEMLRQTTADLTEELSTPNPSSPIVPRKTLSISDNSERGENLILMRGEQAIGEITPRLHRLLEKRRQAISALLPPPKTKVELEVNQRIKNAGKSGLPQALAELERFMLDWLMPNPPIQPSAYYKLIRKRYGINAHLLASPANAFYPIYGSHNAQIESEVKGSFRSEYGEDVYGNLGDVLRDRAAWNRFIDYVTKTSPQGQSLRLEVSIGHLMNYRPVFYELITRLLLSTKRPTTIFVVTTFKDRLSESVRAYVVGDQRRQIDNERELIVLSNEKERVIKSERELEDVLICLGWRYVAPAVTIPRLTSFEKAVAIGKRAVGLANGEKMVLKNVSPEEIDLLNIAEMEFERGVLPVEVLRRLPNGNVVTFDPNSGRV